MSEEKQGFNWGGLAKGILAGAAIAAGIYLVAPAQIGAMIAGIGGMFEGMGAGAGASFLNSGTLNNVLVKGMGVALAAVGLSYLFSDKGPNENAERHAQAFTEAKESFAAREDIRKMQTIMKLRMQAAGHEPAMAATPTR